MEQTIGAAAMIAHPAHELASDLLEGAGAIAEFMFGSAEERRRVYHLASEAKGSDKIPIFRLGNTICARRSTLLHWISEREGKAGRGA